MRTVSAALHARISGDATLAGYCPGELWLDIAPPPREAPRPVMVYSLLRAPLEAEGMCDPIVRRFTYAVSVEGLQSQVATVQLAAGRLEDLLHRAPWSATGWHIAQAKFTDVSERAWVDGDTRLLTVTGQLEIVAEQE